MSDTRIFSGRGRGAGNSPSEAKTKSAYKYIFKPIYSSF
jgi:hypothetical protein